MRYKNLRPIESALHPSAFPGGKHKGQNGRGRKPELYTEHIAEWIKPPRMQEGEKEKIIDWISRIRNEKRRSKEKVGLFINTLFASAGAGAMAFLVTAAVFQADGLVAFLMAYIAACMAAVINPLWLSGRG